MGTSAFPALGSRAESLVRLVPPDLTLDTFDGQAFVGLVPFDISLSRPWALPSGPVAPRFHELNLRTYVHHDGRDPGVWFFSLDAASAAAVIGARTLYYLSYFKAKMRMAVVPDRVPTIHYHSVREWPDPVPAACALSYAPTGDPKLTTPGTLKYFLAERRILYSYHGRPHGARVYHEPYTIQPGVLYSLSESMTAAGLERPAARPMVRYSRRVDVDIYPPYRVTSRKREVAESAGG